MRFTMATSCAMFFIWTTLSPKVTIRWAAEHKMWNLLDAHRAEYAAEHNIGHLYEAKSALASHYRTPDPSNICNPGIGRTSKLMRWR
jgi:hypothetical protein